VTNHRTFKGGYKFLNYAGQPKEILKDIKIPSKVVIPLRQGFGKEAKPLVKVGDKVYCGQIIGRDDSTVSSPVHSSVNGVVEDIKRVNYFKRDVGVVVIRSDGSESFKSLEGYDQNWNNLPAEDIERLIYLSGVSSLDREGIPTRFKSSIIPPEGVEDLIVHGVGSEPYNISLGVLLEGKRLFHFVEALKILKKIMPRARVHLALNFHKGRLLEEAYKLTHQLDWLSVRPLDPKYPQGYDEMLIPTILNKRFPFGYSAANIGVVVLNVQAVLSVYDAVCSGKPFFERIVALCGPSFKENLHIRVRIGTPLEDIMAGNLNEDTPVRVVLNSLLTGFQLNDFSLPVDRVYSQIIAIPENKKREFLAFTRPGLRRDSYSRTFVSALMPFVKKYCDTNIHGEERPCISCTYCEEVCPVEIIPHLLSKYVKRGIIDETIMNYKIFNCIECGLCSFVCPSKISLAKHIKEGQDKLIIQGCDRAQCIVPYFSNLRAIEEYRGVKEL
jgi:Na(+)-translocating NADH:ubiquinone oxidoreductase A subunit